MKNIYIFLFILLVTTSVFAQENSSNIKSIAVAEPNVNGIETSPYLVAKMI